MEARLASLSSPIGQSVEKAAAAAVSTAVGDEIAEANIPEALKYSSFFVMEGTNPFRKLTYMIAHHRLFEGLVLLIILVNCVTLALDDPTKSEQPDWSTTIDILVLSVFTLEMALKLISLGGALHPGAYFRNGWNWLDFFIVALAYIKYIPGVGNFTAITVLRALRPLRSVNAIPQLKAIVLCLVHSVKGLVNVFVLALFMYSIFAIFAVQLWMGNFKTRCFFAPGKPDPNMYCTQSTAGSVSGASCPAPMFCDFYENPNGGISSFDNFAAALLVVFQCVTLESWSVMMYIGMDTCGWPAAIFFLLVILFGSYFVLNLFLAVISGKFVEIKEQQLEEEKKVAEEAEKAALLLTNQRNARWAEERHTKPVEGTEHEEHHHAELLNVTKTLTSEEPELALLRHQLLQTITGRMLFVFYRKQLFTAEEVDTTCGFRGIVDSSVYPYYGPVDKIVEAVMFARKILHDFTEGKTEAVHLSELRDIEVSRLDVLGDDEAADDIKLSIPDADTTYFMLFVYFCIFANMVVLAIDRFDAPESQEAVSKELNFAFTVVFGVEMLLRIVALGPVEYCTNVASLFDGCVTFISIIELSVLSGSSSFSVLRAFRMLRVLRLFRAVPALRAIMEVFILALRETGYFNVIFLLYFLIASLIGMQIFGDALDSQNPKLSSFSSFLNSFYTVVQIITFDSWPDNMWIAMQNTSTAACVYFICCVLIGNFVILNLLLAILINSFEEGGGLPQVEEEGEMLNELDDIAAQRLFYGSGSTPRDGSSCPQCGEPMVPLLTKFSHKIEHDEVMCARIQERLKKMRLIGALVSKATTYRGDDIVDILEQKLENAALFSRKPSRRSTPRGPLQAEVASQRPMSSRSNNSFTSSISPEQDVPSDKLETDVAFTECNLVPLCGFPFESERQTLLTAAQNHDIHVPVLEASGTTPSWEAVLTGLEDEFAFVYLRAGEEIVGGAAAAVGSKEVADRPLTNGGVSLYLLGPDNILREKCTIMIAHPLFEVVVMATVLASSITLAMDNPRNSIEFTDKLDMAGNVFTVIFCVESAIKILAYGFVLGPGTYLRDMWNVLDFFVVIISVLSWILSTVIESGLSSLKILRTLRVLRPLLFINKWRGLRMVVMTLVKSIKGIASMALVAFLIFLIFSILAVQLFGGRLYSCNDPAIQQKINCVGKYNVTVEKYINITNGTYGEVNETRQRFWVNRGFNYDNTGNALVALLHMATLDNWGADMYWAIGATDHYNGNVSRRQTWVGLFFVIFVLFGAIFLMNMFFGVVTSNYQATKEKLDGLSLLTDDQKLWVETQRMMLNFRPERLKRTGSTPFQQAVGRVVMDPRFDAISGVVVLCNIIVIALDHDKQSPKWESFQLIMNFIFNALFIVEASMKIITFEKRYFAESWNQFDFFIVLVGIMDLAITDVIPFNVGLLRVLRVFRIMRILVLIRKAKDVRILLETLWYSIPSLANIGAFMFLLLFVFSVLGVQLFSLIPQDGVGLTTRMNFENFGTAFLFLIQLMTLDNWGATMLSVSDNALCGTSPEGDEVCGTPMCVFYFFPFVTISGYVTVNLFCATILDNFETTMEIDKSALKMSDLKKFVDAWAVFDPDACMTIPTSKFPTLLALLKPPLGIARAKDRLALLRMTRGYTIPEHGGVIHFVETLIPLARQVMEVQLSPADIRGHEETWKNEFPDLNLLPVLHFRNSRVTVDQYIAATYIAAAYRRRIASETLLSLIAEKSAAIEKAYDAQGVPMHMRYETRRLDKFKHRRTATRMRLLEERNAKSALVNNPKRSMSVLRVQMLARTK